MEKATASDNRDLIILDRIKKNPETTQASLAAQLGVAVGTVNWHLKRLIEKGYVKMRRIKRHKIHYIITPPGLALRARLMIDFIHSSFNLYRLVRERSLKAIDNIRTHGFASVRVVGENDVAEICRLTCMEQGIQLTEDKNVPVLKVIGLKIFVELEVSEKDNGD